MARSILVLILATAPALAQYNANTYNVRPSGGSVGQVCFYETAANGSNKFCITGENSLSGDTSTSVASLLSWTRSGTNTYLTNAGDSVGINTSTPTYQFTVESATYTSGERFLFGARAADGSVSVVAGYRADGATGTAGIFRAGGNKPLDLGTTGTPQAIRIEDGGNVGIGTTSPGALLHVDGLVLADSGDFAPTGGTGNYVQSRKFEFVDVNGGADFFDARAYVHATSGQRYLEFRDNAGTPLIQFWRQETGSVAVDYADVFVDLRPDTDGGQALGSTSAPRSVAVCTTSSTSRDLPTPVSPST